MAEENRSKETLFLSGASFTVEGPNEKDAQNYRPSGDDPIDPTLTHPPARVTHQNPGNFDTFSREMTLLRSFPDQPANSNELPETACSTNNVSSLPLDQPVLLSRPPRKERVKCTWMRVECNAWRWHYGPMCRVAPMHDLEECKWQELREKLLRKKK
jgi:hypothetical protein